MSEEREFLYRVLGRLEAKTDALHDDIRAHIATDAIFHTKVEDRIRELERADAKTEGEITSRFIVPRHSFPPGWVKNVIKHTAVKVVMLVLAGGSAGVALRSLFHW